MRNRLFPPASAENYTKKNPNSLSFAGPQGGKLDLRPQRVPQPCCILLLLQGVHLASRMEKVFPLHGVRGSIAQQPGRHAASPCSRVCCKPPHSSAASCGEPGSFTAPEPRLIHTAEPIALPSSQPAMSVQLINTGGKHEPC